VILSFIADGRSIHTQRWAAYFARRGHGVHLITYDPMGIVIDGVIEHVISSSWNNLYLSYIPRHFAIKRLMQKIGPDLVHAHFIAKYGFHLPDLNGFPSIVSAWGDDILILPKKNPLIRYYTKKVLDSADLIYALSRDIRDHIISDFSIPQDRVKYLPFGIDTGMFTPRENEKCGDGKTVLVFSNRGFFPVYDSATLIRGFALAHEKDPNLRLFLKGDGPEEETVKVLAESLGILSAVAFMKKTDYTEVPKDYRKADIFVTTSVSDGTPVSLLEAMSSALPCIATSVGGIPEWITNGENGILVPPSAPEMVANAILRLGSDPDLRCRLGAAARATILARGEWDTLMAQVEKDYEELVNTYRKKRS
jgi:glycosyltransferase involved in cell wall biosynthesis